MIMDDRVLSGTLEAFAGDILHLLAGSDDPIFPHRLAVWMPMS